MFTRNFTDPGGDRAADRWHSELERASEAPGGKKLQRGQRGIWPVKSAVRCSRAERGAVQGPPAGPDGPGRPGTLVDDRLRDGAVVRPRWPALEPRPTR